MEEENPIPSRICVEYPGVVKNITKAVETLGGPTTLSEVFCDPLRLLQLHFRPKDRLCKPVTAIRKKSTSFLLSIKVKKKSRRFVSYEIVEFVNEEFKFSSFCDFQYLALEDEKYVYDKALPTKLDPSWLMSEGPSFLVPAWFSRSDANLNYYFGKESRGDESAPTVIATSRRRRPGLACFLLFEDNEVPTEPPPPPLNFPVIKSKNIEMLMKLFEERPVVSRSAMIGMTGISEKKLKFDVPQVAYRFQNGPWRAMWVKYGYDPRKDPSSRIYQTLDFRISKGDSAVVTKRPPRVRKPQFLPKRTKESKEEVNERNEAFILRPGELPPSRQFFYQYCDVQLPEVQAMLAAVEPRTVCHSVDGWLPEGTSFACRRIIKQYVVEAIKQRNDELPDLSDDSDLSEGESSSEGTN